MARALLSLGERRGGNCNGLLRMAGGLAGCLHTGNDWRAQLSGGRGSLRPSHGPPPSHHAAVWLVAARTLLGWLRPLWHRLLQVPCSCNRRGQAQQARLEVCKHVPFGHVGRLPRLHAENARRAEPRRRAQLRELRRQLGRALAAPGRAAGRRVFGPAGAEGAALGQLVSWRLGWILREGPLHHDQRLRDRRRQPGDEHGGAPEPWLLGDPRAGGLPDALQLSALLLDRRVAGEDKLADVAAMSVAGRRQREPCRGGDAGFLASIKLICGQRRPRGVQQSEPRAQQLQGAVAAIGPVHRILPWPSAGGRWPLRA
mmetsp:Transcript_35757/g.111219  ORF Transcript_35757/g.111219 Transcript_35757/m.111219 type:complete len:314 (-) Transcript_35757:62-1003(-)